MMNYHPIILLILKLVNNMEYNELLNKLYEYKDEKYKLFNDKIINTKLKTIGVKTPILKLTAKI